MLFLVVLFSFGILVNPPTAHASFFSFLGDLFGDSSENTEVSQNVNSQNMALLQAALNIDPNPSKGGGDITIVGDSALLPDAGPLGTIADVEETPASDQISIYVVRQGDNELFRQAKRPREIYICCQSTWKSSLKFFNAIRTAPK